MKAITILTLSLMPLLLKAVELKVIVKNVQPGKGSVVVDVYGNKNDFLKKSIVSKKQLADKNELVFTFDLPPGEYAIAVYQDINDNKQLDFGLFHIPKEPTGFSNNFRPRFGPPEFKDCSFKLTSQPQAVQIELK